MDGEEVEGDGKEEDQILFPYYSTLFQRHRVTLSDPTKDRKSLVFFMLPDDEFMIHPINGDTKNFPPINPKKAAQDYMKIVASGAWKNENCTGKLDEFE